MKVICPFCGIAGEIPDRPNPKPLRCRNCGTRFQPKPLALDDFGAANSSAVDDSTEQLIDVDHLVSHTSPDLGIRLDDGFSMYSPSRNSVRRAKSVGPLGFLVTLVAVVVNCVVLSIFVKIIADDLRVIQQAEVNRGIAAVGTGWDRDYVTLNQANSLLGWHILYLSFVGSLPLLGELLPTPSGGGSPKGMTLSRSSVPLV